MAVSATLPLLGGDFVNGAVDYKGRPVTRSKTGGWSSAVFIIGVEIAERLAYYGVSSNLITYLTGPLRQSTATAAENVNVWSGVASMLPLLGAFVADSCLGRYRTIFAGSVIYILALGMLTLSAVLPSLRPPECITTVETTACPAPSEFQVVFFFFFLYLMAIGQGAHKPCLQAFGADQFDEQHPEECKSKSSFFNWWYFGLCCGPEVFVSILNYIQDYVGWGLGFGFPCVSMAFALATFLLGTKIYRNKLPSGENPFAKIVQFFASATQNWNTHSSSTRENHGFDVQEEATEQNQFKAAGNSDNSNCCSAFIVNQAEETKWVLRLSPIWTTCLMYAVVFAQCSTLFTKQSATMDRKIGSSFEVPAAALQSFITFSVLILIPIYDWILIPATRTFTRIPSGITILQRIGIGMFLSVISMVLAALVEMKRLKTARDFGLIDIPTVTVPMSAWSLIPQYMLSGASDVFTMVGLQEFFYDQMPNGLQSLGIALYLSIFGVGNFLSGFLISLIDRVTSEKGDSWFSNNLNKAHLDYFYCLLAVLSALALGVFLFFAKSYVYKRSDKR